MRIAVDMECISRVIQALPLEEVSPIRRIIQAQHPCQARILLSVHPPALALPLNGLIRQRIPIPVRQLIQRISPLWRGVPACEGEKRFTRRESVQGRLKYLVLRLLLQLLVRRGYELLYLLPRRMGTLLPAVRRLSREEDLQVLLYRAEWAGMLTLLQQ